MACFIFRTKRGARVPPVPLVVEECWQTKKARVSGCTKRRSVHFVFGSTEPGNVHVHTEDDDVAQFQSDAAQFHTEPWNVEVHTDDNSQTDAAQFQSEHENIEVHTNENIQTDATQFQSEPSSVKKPVNKIKMLSELVCVEEGEPKTRCAKKGTRRGRKRKM